MNRSTHDVIIVGARCAGSATAMLLARRGLRVLVLDRARYGSDTVSTHALMRGGVLQLQRWGLLDEIVAAGTPPVTRVVFHYPDETTPISLKPAAGVRALYAPRRTVLDRVLADAAIAAGADVRFGVTVTELLRDDTGRVTGVAGNDADGRRLLASAPLTVGADGIRSLVAREVGAPVIRTARSDGSAVLYGYWDDLPVDGYEWLYAPGAGAGLIPTNDGQTGVFVGTTPTQMKAARRAGTAQHAFSTLLETVSPAAAERVSAARAPRRLRGFAGVPGYLRQSWGPGWALVGDAGLLRRSAQHARHHRCAAGRRAAGPLRWVRFTAEPRARRARWPDTRRRGTHSPTGCSARSKRSHPSPGRSRETAASAARGQLGNE